MTAPLLNPLPGETYGCFQVVAPLSGPGVAVRERRFAVRTLCCGSDLVRGYRALRESWRAERVRCERCQNRLRAARMRTLVPGTRFGPVVIVAPAGTEFRVRWDCCGREALVSSPRLYILRHEAKTGQAPRCRACYLAARAAAKALAETPTLAPLLAPGGIPAGLAWPRPAGCSMPSPGAV